MSHFIQSLGSHKLTKRLGKEFFCPISAMMATYFLALTIK